ncbi:MAG TPA: type II toxin-antitoxin system MqsA family antitoxin [Dehalococcoidia bacterium]|nr:type II toxin-antitoxin system MqsA family antitoxin [Dehalococcoidia bacterium]
MPDSLDRRPLCGGDKKRRETTFAVDLKFGIVVVRNVPALVCVECGESWVEDDVAATLENVVADARLKGEAVAVSEWEQIAA